MRDSARRCEAVILFAIRAIVMERVHTHGADLIHAPHAHDPNLPPHWSQNRRGSKQECSPIMPSVLAPM